MSIIPSRSPRGPYKNTYTKDDIIAALTAYRSAASAGRRINFSQAGAPITSPHPPCVDTIAKLSLLLPQRLAIPLPMTF